MRRSSVDACQLLIEKGQRFGESNYVTLAWRSIVNKCYFERTTEACNLAFSVETKKKNFESASHFARAACSDGDLSSCDLALNAMAQFNAEPEQTFYVLRNRCRIQDEQGRAPEFCEDLLTSEHLTPELWATLKERKDVTDEPLIPDLVQSQSK